MVKEDKHSCNAKTNIQKTSEFLNGLFQFHQLHLNKKVRYVHLYTGIPARGHWCALLTQSEHENILFQLL